MTHKRFRAAVAISMFFVLVVVGGIVDPVGALVAATIAMCVLVCLPLFEMF